ncbi:phage holin family protein [Fodinibius sp.]|uniref:phage holin family protein n=1 Tax=Fodinibius sp. TaxID=1872440 RepID=UPI002ACDC99F|nr:phage holin family protein [Fodinibius sp.]MDZ7659276.1 phage holin family protein [Fodinibius sp.]
MKTDKQKDQFGKRLRAITADLKLYLEKRIELTMLNIGEAISGLMAASVQRGIGVFLLLGGLCFLLFALAIYLGDLLESRSLGYVLVSLPLLLVGGLFMYLKPKSVFKQLQHRFENEVIKSIEQNGETVKETLKIEKEGHSKSKEG